LAKKNNRKVENMAAEQATATNESQRKLKIGVVGIGGGASEILPAMEKMLWSGCQDLPANLLA